MILGIVYALLASGFFASNRVFVRKGSLSADVYVGTMLTVFIGPFLIAAYALVVGQLGMVTQFSLRSYVFLIIAGIIHFIMGRFLSYNAIRYLGANRLGVLSSLVPLWAVFLGILILKERLSLPLEIGVVLILGGTFLASYRPTGGKPISHHDLVHGLILAVLGSLAYGTSPVFIKVAMSTVKAPVVAVLISYLSASLVLLGLLAVRPEIRRRLKKLRGEGGKSFFVAGFTVAMAQIFRYSALALIPVTLVAPIQYTNSLMTIGISYLLLREVESFTPKVLGGAALTFSGVLLIFFGRGV